LELNTELVRGGYACALAVGTAGRSRAEEFATYEAEARTARLGMWGACQQVPCAAK
jgi:micrococcal nuclease